MQLGPGTASLACARLIVSFVLFIVSQLCGARYFTKLDVRWGFNNVCIKPRDEWKAAF